LKIFLTGKLSTNTDISLLLTFYNTPTFLFNISKSPCIQRVFVLRRRFILRFVHPSTGFDPSTASVYMSWQWQEKERIYRHFHFYSFLLLQRTRTKSLLCQDTRHAKAAPTLINAAGAKFLILSVQQESWPTRSLSSRP
jgi:hypothetical protein